MCAAPPGKVKCRGLVGGDRPERVGERGSERKPPEVESAGRRIAPPVGDMGGVERCRPPGLEMEVGGEEKLPLDCCCPGPATTGERDPRGDSIKPPFLGVGETMEIGVVMCKALAQQER